MGEVSKQQQKEQQKMISQDWRKDSGFTLVRQQFKADQLTESRDTSLCITKLHA